MLILTRKFDQYIVIDGRITVRVIGWNSARVTLGIDAPKEVSIVRGELLDVPAQRSA